MSMVMMGAGIVMVVLTLMVARRAGECVAWICLAAFLVMVGATVVVNHPYLWGAI